MGGFCYSCCCSWFIEFVGGFCDSCCCSWLVGEGDGGEDVEAARWALDFAHFEEVVEGTLDLEDGGVG